MLGAEVEDPAENNKEDGWITVVTQDNVYEAVLEVKSTRSNQFSEDGRKQLLDWVDRGRSMRQKNYKGIFVGNSAVDKPVGERPDAFSDSWRKNAELSQICAIKTEHLYCVYLLYCRGNFNVMEFWQRLFNTNGVFDPAPYLDQLDQET